MHTARLWRRPVLIVTVASAALACTASVASAARPAVVTAGRARRCIGESEVSGS